MNRRLLGSLALAAFVAAGAAPVSADMFARVTGRVTVGDSSAGLSTVVTVSDGDGRTFDIPTDREGRFSAIGLQPGSVSVSLNVEGLRQVQYTCSVPPGETGRFDLGAFDARPPQLISAPMHIWTGKATQHGCSLEASTVDQYVIQ
jgi:hypothetical protein